MARQTPSTAYAAAAAVLAAVAVLVCSGAPGAAAAAPASAVPFTFQTWFAGEWDVQRTEVSGGELVHSDVLGRYVVARRNGSEALEGSSFDNDTATGEVTNELALAVEFADGSASAGTFMTGADPEELAPLFEFAFETQHNGMHVSHGRWGAKSSYQFVAAHKDLFIITVRPDGGGGDATLFTGKRVVRPVPKTFFQQYGTMIMLGCFFLFNTYMRRSNAAAAQAPQAAAAGAAPVSETATPAAGQGAKKDQ